MVSQIFQKYLGPLFRLRSFGDTESRLVLKMPSQYPNGTEHSEAMTDGGTFDNCIPQSLACYAATTLLRLQTSFTSARVRQQR
jgi:hypothetical protein